MGHVAAAVALALTACTAGCLGRAKTTDFFTLSPVASSEREAVASRPDLALAVGPMQFPRYLDRPEIVTRDGGNRLVMAEWHRWGGSLRTDILRVVADDLGALLGTKYVAVYPAEPHFPLDYRIVLDVRQFEGTPGRAVRLRAYWSIVSGRSGKAVAIDVSDVEQPIASTAWEDLVAAHSAALGTMTRQIAARLAALPAP